VLGGVQLCSLLQFGGAQVQAATEKARLRVGWDGMRQELELEHGKASLSFLGGLMMVPEGV